MVEWNFNVREQRNNTKYYISVWLAKNSMSQPATDHINNSIADEVVELLG